MPAKDHGRETALRADCFTGDMEVETDQVVQPRGPCNRKFNPHTLGQGVCSSEQNAVTGQVDRATSSSYRLPIEDKPVPERRVDRVALTRTPILDEWSNCGCHDKCHLLDHTMTSKKLATIRPGGQGIYTEDRGLRAMENSCGSKPVTSTFCRFYG